jgi:hypothetical protein
VPGTTGYIDLCKQLMSGSVTGAVPQPGIMGHWQWSGRGGWWGLKEGLREGGPLG